MHTTSKAGRRIPALTLPAAAGLGLKPEHADDILDETPQVGFFEVHAENYMGEGGAPHRLLTSIAATYPLSLHGVGLSIGGEGPLDRGHLKRLRTLIDRYRPASFSEHLAWSTHDSTFFNDLLPLPYTQATLERVARHVAETQDALGVRMLLENPATYLVFTESTLDEVDFLAAVAERTGCGLLLDVNNVMVSAVNHGLDAFGYIDRFPVERVGEIHLAGYEETVDDAGERLLIDTHGSPVLPDVFSLYRHTLRRTGPVATLVEWDNDVPDFPTLHAEAVRVEAALAEARDSGFGRRAAGARWVISRLQRPFRPPPSRPRSRLPLRCFRRALRHTAGAGTNGVFASIATTSGPASCGRSPGAFPSPNGSSGRASSAPWPRPSSPPRSRRARCSCAMAAASPASSRPTRLRSSFRISPMSRVSRMR